MRFCQMLSLLGSHVYKQCLTSPPKTIIVDTQKRWLWNSRGKKIKKPFLPKEWDLHFYPRNGTYMSNLDMTCFPGIEDQTPKVSSLPPSSRPPYFLPFFLPHFLPSFYSTSPGEEGVRKEASLRESTEKIRKNERGIVGAFAKKITPITFQRK